MSVVLDRNGEESVGVCLRAADSELFVCGILCRILSFELIFVRGLVVDVLGASDAFPDGGRRVLDDLLYVVPERCASGIEPYARRSVALNHDCSVELSQDVRAFVGGSSLLNDDVGA